MTHKLVLEVSEEVYEPLQRISQQTGKRPEALAAEWLAANTVHAARDPLERFIGAFRSNVPDWADKHDHYLGQALYDELRGREPAGS